ncbi:hypothetical protein RFI_39184, partial [Reticulomyxa filosa]
FIEKEHELFLAKLLQNSANEELSVMAKRQEAQMLRIAALEQTTKQQMALLSSKQQEFDQIKQQYALLNEQRVNDRRQSHLNSELLQHQLETTKVEHQKSLDRQQKEHQEELEKEKNSLWNRFFNKNKPNDSTTEINPINVPALTNQSNSTIVAQPQQPSVDYI